MFAWRDGMMVPHERFAQLCERQFVEGQDYALTVIEEVSGKSRAHLFAVIRDTWMSLPENDKRFPSSEHLRKWALVQVGHSTETDFVLDTVRDAKATALALRKADEYAIIILSGKVVKLCTAKSLSGPDAKHEKFQEVKTKVMDLLASLTGVDAATLSSNAGTSA